MRPETISRFAFHKPDAVGVEKMTAIRKKIRELAYLIEETCPESREKSTSLTQLATVMMHANSAIVQSYPVDPKDLGEIEKQVFKDNGILLE